MRRAVWRVAVWASTTEEQLQTTVRRPGTHARRSTDGQIVIGFTPRRQPLNARSGHPSRQTVVMAPHLSRAEVPSLLCSSLSCRRARGHLGAVTSTGCGAYSREPCEPLGVAPVSLSTRCG